jgi:hypothetical protein
VSPELPFWKTTPLSDLTPDQWESLCDGCGQCCLLKVEDEDTGRIFSTRLACQLLDIGTCRCRDYANRLAHVPDCVRLDAGAILELPWLPPTCAYRRLAEGWDLAWWHPLVSGDPETVHQAGVSIRGWARSETGVPASKLAHYIVDEI